MEPVKKTAIVKKSLKVATESMPPIPDPVEEPSIEAVKKPKKTPEEIQQTRLANLAKGQAGLQKRREEARQKKAEMETLAIDKKLKLAAKQKKAVEDSYGVSLDEEEEEEEEPAPIVVKPKKKVAVAPPPPKKKPIRYVVEESESEEEEIVYVKRQAPAVPKAKPTPLYTPQIIFY
jgi:hypothetical protein